MRLTILTNARLKTFQDVVNSKSVDNHVVYYSSDNSNLMQAVCTVSKRVF